MTREEWDKAVQEWDKRNYNKHVSEREPFPGNMTHIAYPNGFYVVRKEYIDEIKRELKRELKKEMEANA